MKRKFNVLLILSVLAMFFVMSCEKESNSSPTGPSGDTEDPTITITAPDAGSTLYELTTISVTATDNEGVAGILVYIDTLLVAIQSYETPLEEQSESFEVDITSLNLEAGEYQLRAYATDEAANIYGVYILVNIESSGTAFISKFVNTTYTEMSITVGGFSERTIAPGDSSSFSFSSNPGSYSYTASTSGETNSGSQVGNLLNWNFTHNVSGLESKRTNLVVSSDFFFASLENGDDNYFDRVIANPGTAYENESNIDVFVDGLVHGLGYFTTVEEAEFRAYFQNSSEFIYWEGYSEYLSGLNNQGLIFQWNIGKNGKSTKSLSFPIFDLKNSDLSIKK